MLGFRSARECQPPPVESISSTGRQADMVPASGIVEANGGMIHAPDWDVTVNASVLDRDGFGLVRSQTMASDLIV
jgi:hypothetical protein